MITLKKIKSLKERVKIRKCGEVFHLIHKGQMTEEEGEIFSYFLSLLDDESKEKAKYSYSLGRLDDLYYLSLDVLGESVADWDSLGDDGLIDFSKRTIFPHYLYIDSIRSPFNIGSIFRSAEAFGIEKIYLRPGSADPRHSRALKSSKGCVDAIPYEFKELEELDLPIFALELGGEDITTFNFPERGICVLGSEEEGVSKSALSLADKSLGRVSIKMYGAKGSINVASSASIMLSLWANSSAMKNRGV